MALAIAALTEPCLEREGLKVRFKERDELEPRGKHSCWSRGERTAPRAESCQTTTLGRKEHEVKQSAENREGILDVHQRLITR